MSKKTKEIYIYVISKNGKPLMPTKRYRRVRLLLKSGKVKVVKRKPFTIQLLYETREYTQKLTLGIDPGSEKLGFTVRNENNEVVCAGEVESRKTKVSKNMLERKMHRQSRRQHSRQKKKRRAQKNNTDFVEKQYKISGTEKILNCKVIKPSKIRFCNRIRQKGWLTPTAINLLRTHVNIVAQIKKIMPVDEIYIEYSKFDIHKLKKPEIKGKEYQEGRKKGFLNSQAYVLCRDNHKCKLCEKNKGVLEVHHMLKVSDGGTNNPENLVTLCEKCHKKVHKDLKIATKLKKIFGKLKKRHVHTTILNTIMPLFYEWLIKNFSKVSITYGYKTKEKRRKFSLEKTHALDAYLISLNSNNPNFVSANFANIKIYQYKQFRRHHRQLIHATRDRNYKLDNKIVAKNRNKRMGQLTNSLADFVEINGKNKLTKLKILSGKKVIRSKFKKLKKGDTVKYKRKRYVVKGYGEMGRSIGFVGKKEYVATKKCKLIIKNTGLVCL